MKIKSTSIDIRRPITKIHLTHNGLPPLRVRLLNISTFEFNQKHGTAAMNEHSLKNKVFIRDGSLGYLSTSKIQR